MRYSLVHASYKPFGQSKKVRDQWLNKARSPERVEHLLGFEFDDFMVREEYQIFPDTRIGVTPDGLTRFITTKPENTPSSVRNWNAAASLSTAEFIIVISDDVVPDTKWDVLLDEITSEFHPDDLVLLKVTDGRCSSYSEGISDVLLPRHPVVSRGLLIHKKSIFNPVFPGYGTDSLLLIESIRETHLRDARRFKLHHSTGAILSESGQLLCGCNPLMESREVTLSKSRMEEHKVFWNYRHFNKQVGFFWSFLEALLNTPKVCDEVFFAYSEIVKTKLTLLEPHTLLRSTFKQRGFIGSISWTLIILKCLSHYVFRMFQARFQ